ncbi:cation-independent mannose-6-phosphate receptor [Anopheles funestus]|uniref:cation-independent mannose-6-phosphate receptor n=1 Tax=Anopheles funestus TaxID=62324 RepID=UPI0020C63FED|nr:cation-independent mannose-6-phosphate receptor [Anopheles funestus]
MLPIMPQKENDMACSRPFRVSSASGGRLSIGLIVVTLMLMVTGAQSKLLVNGTDCTIREPLYNVTFDFNALSSDLNHHVTSEETNERFFFNVCDKEQSGKDNRTEPLAYLVRQDKKITLGYEAHLQLDNGRMQFSFLGEPCGNGSNYTLDIILLCSYERTPADLRVIPHTPDQCRYFIFWDTPLACQPLPTALVDNRCTVRDGTNRHLYNLLPLGGANHEVPLPDGGRFVVSVCKPVRYGHLTMCPPGTGVCLINGTDYRDYGQAVAEPKIDSTGRLVMEMRSKSEACQNSLIVFECGAEDGIETGPIYRGRKDNCTHEFVWRTTLACRDTRPCSVSNPITGTQYDLSLLANRTYTLTSRDNRTYELGVCRIPASSHCPLDAGACEVTAKQSVGLGAISAELQYETTGAPYLLYRSGAVCDANSGRRWETRLEFICETDPVEGGRTGTVVPPIVVENGECQLVVHFETVLVCEPALMACGAYNESTIDQYVDLSPLMDSTQNYVARSEGDQGRRYFLNVCRPLVPQYGLSCRGGAAACEATFDGVTARNETTLGFPDVSLVVAGNTVLMKYLRGDPCPQDPLTNLSTTVAFHCQATAGRGQPALVEIEHGCHYRFDWATAVICPPELTVPFEQSNCSFHNPSTATWMGMNGVLDELSLCDKQPVASIDYRTGSLTIRYTEPDTINCSSMNGVKTYNVTVACAPDRPLERIASTSCFEIIKKQSPTVCALVGRNATIHDDSVPTNPTKSPAHSTTHPTTVPTVTSTEPIGTKVQPEGAGLGAFGIVMICLTAVTTLSVGTLYIVRRHPDRCHQLHSILLCRGSFWVINDFPSTTYSRVDNSETSSLLLNPSNVLSDSDDDMLI